MALQCLRMVLIGSQINSTINIHFWIYTPNNPPQNTLLWCSTNQHTFKLPFFSLQKASMCGFNFESHLRDLLPLYLITLFFPGSPGQVVPASMDVCDGRDGLQGDRPSVQAETRPYRVQTRPVRLLLPWNSARARRAVPRSRHEIYYTLQVESVLYKNGQNAQYSTTVTVQLWVI